MAASVIPIVQLFFRFLLSTLLSPDGKEVPLLTRRAAVQLSALRKLGPLDPVCDQRGRERKFCQPELQHPRRPPTGSVRGVPQAKCALVLAPPGSPQMRVASNDSSFSTVHFEADDATFIDPSPICAKDQLPHCDEDFLDAGMKVVMDEDCLNGQQKVVADGMMSQEECDVLLKFGGRGIPGNGYYESPHPMTTKELFVGFRSSDVMEELQSSADTARAMKVMLAVSDRARLYTEAYFRLKRRLYMHLVQVNCRTAEEDSTLNRTDMSHQIHADNCQYQDNASCPVLVLDIGWRDFSAAVYLNDDAHGGELVFATTPRTSVRSIVRPKCGRMVSFNSRNPHGVLPVFSGRRCAVLVWMTHTKERQEAVRLEIENILGYSVANSSHRYV
ncbi:prolyl 3-hydroxylase 3-like [Rhipicephalus microplus]|uniref:prolyl 3-hydroxylase 3-like n=1 Tax=Rhipicephalus microplus TaxID=6941 RepID=UPI003F6D05E1